MFEEWYRRIAAAVDAEFARNKRIYGERIRCGPGCSSCCSQVFHISGMEAAEIARAMERLDSVTRDEFRVRAREYLEGNRRACPALRDEACSIYEARPLICHKFGMPIYNPDKPGQIFACELNFSNGDEITDDKLIQIQTDIHLAWKDLRQEYRRERPSSTNRKWNVAQAILDADSILQDETQNSL